MSPPDPKEPQDTTPTIPEPEPITIDIPEPQPIPLDPPEPTTPSAPRTPTTGGDE
jgi:hypothetical protein